MIIAALYWKQNTFLINFRFKIGRGGAFLLSAWRCYGPDNETHLRQQTASKPTTDMHKPQIYIKQIKEIYKRQNMETCLILQLDKV